MDYSSVGRMGPEWFKAPDSAQSGYIKVSTDPNHWKKTIIGSMEAWWCGKCFIKKTAGLFRREKENIHLTHNKLK